MNAEILAPISLGELIDKITILELKRQHLSGQALQHVTSELVALTSTLKRLRIRLKSQHLTDLRKVNATLWRIEDEIREMERQQDFGDAFISLARSVYKENDRRAAIKREINTTYGSRIQEEKSYRSS